MKHNIQIAPSVIMVRPAAFGYNPETAGSNSFQQFFQLQVDSNQIGQDARKEFDRMVEKLQAHNIEVIVIEDGNDLKRPDAVFPNNWFSTHEDGTLVLYPMMSEVRRLERLNPVFEKLANSYMMGDIIDLSYFEKREKFLEGTGSIVFDHVNSLAYACVSPRTDREILKILCDELRYKAIAFTAMDRNEQEIYHTNVMLAIGETTVVICSDSIPDHAEREAVLKSLKASGREIVEISVKQMENFAGNLLNVHNREKKSYWVMSKTAYDIFTPKQLDILGRDAEIIAVEIPLIEQLGGGSARCMLAECFLPGHS